MKYLIAILLLTSCRSVPHQADASCPPSFCSTDSVQYYSKAAQDRCAELMELAMDNGVDVPSCEE